MRGIDFQIHFERIIQEMSDAFIDRERPDTFTIFKFIGQAQIRYLKEKYLSLPTTEENIRYLQQRSDDLRNLIKTVVISTSAATTGVYSGKAKYIDVLDDYVHYVRSDSQVTRTDAIAIASATYVPNKIVSHSEIDRLISTPWNYPILRSPVVVFEESDRIYIIHDTYTATLPNVSLTYLRRPYNFDTQYTAYGVDVSDVATGIRMRALTATVYLGTTYQVGDYLTKVVNQNPLTSGTVCTPYDAIDETAECEFSYHTHDDILRLAVQMYIEEAKFRLNIKPERIPEGQQ